MNDVAVSVVEGAGSLIIADNIIDGAQRAFVGCRRSAPPPPAFRVADGATGIRHLRIAKNLVS